MDWYSNNHRNRDAYIRHGRGCHLCTKVIEHNFNSRWVNKMLNFLLLKLTFSLLMPLM